MELAHNSPLRLFRNPDNIPGFNDNSYQGIKNTGQVFKKIINLKLCRNGSLSFMFKNLYGCPIIAKKGPPVAVVVIAKVQMVDKLLIVIK